MLPKAQLGRLRERGTGRAARPARRGTPVGRRPHRRRARPGGRVDDHRDLRAAGRRDVRRRRPVRTPRRPAARTRLRRARDPRSGRRTCPTGPEYAAVRAPIAEGGGYAWFANRGIGRPVAESLRDTMDWFRTWLDDAAPGRPPGAAGRLQRRRRLRRRSGARRPCALRRRGHPLRDPALRRRPRHRPRPTGQPARVRGPGRRRPRHPA